MDFYNFKVLLEPDETGGFVVSCPQLEGCYTQGETLQEAIANIKEVIEMCLEELEDANEEIPYTENVFVSDVVIAR